MWCLPLLGSGNRQSGAAFIASCEDKDVWHYGIWSIWVCIICWVPWTSRETKGNVTRMEMNLQPNYTFLPGWNGTSGPPVTSTATTPASWIAQIHILNNLWNRVLGGEKRLLAQSNNHKSLFNMLLRIIMSQNESRSASFH
jgi:hypothetical protein